MTKMEHLVFKISGFHLDRQMINSKFVVQFDPQLFE